ncbi:hypothetical protein FHU37_002076 [Allostreptomyces psammosilenae]|uniref:Uncharacterized protein n=1 Tax=Allostreptomyces psammosilenae TaxID=1892865 RepID=A0A852ZRX0_9ACTN|nr:hypothetical protein [Allostreptomyces psammosilenae]
MPETLSLASVDELIRNAVHTIVPADPSTDSDGAGEPGA